MTKSCPVCDSEYMTPQVSINSVALNGKSYELVSHYSICGICGCEIAFPEDINMNASLMKELRQSVENEMTDKLKELKL